ncbi:uncharacterized protein DS421_20g682270 [Arachis hypogaea]|nr:uncharacterized protein DS421_20g682270 [Arachis hypogaea]
MNEEAEAETKGKGRLSRRIREERKARAGVLGDTITPPSDRRGRRTPRLPRRRRGGHCCRAESRGRLEGAAVARELMEE